MPRMNELPDYKILALLAETVASSNVIDELDQMVMNARKRIDQWFLVRDALRTLTDRYEPQAEPELIEEYLQKARRLMQDIELQSEALSTQWDDAAWDSIRSQRAELGDLVPVLLRHIDTMAVAQAQLHALIRATANHYMREPEMRVSTWMSHVSASGVPLHAVIPASQADILHKRMMFAHLR